MVLHLSVSHSFHGGGCLPLVLVGRGVCHIPPGPTPALADTPPLGRHLSWADPHPWADPPPLGRPPTPAQIPPWADTPWEDIPWADTPLHSACQDTVNKRAVRILLECILVLEFFNAF